MSAARATPVRTRQTHHRDGTLRSSPRLPHAIDGRRQRPIAPGRTLSRPTGTARVPRAARRPARRAVRARGRWRRAPIPARGPPALPLDRAHPSTRQTSTNSPSTPASEYLSARLVVTAAPKTPSSIASAAASSGGESGAGSTHIGSSPPRIAPNPRNLAPNERGGARASELLLGRGSRDAARATYNW